MRLERERERTVNLKSYNLFKVGKETRQKFVSAKREKEKEKEEREKKMAKHKNNIFKFVVIVTCPITK